jgi:hypothetical protein
VHFVFLRKCERSFHLEPCPSHRLPAP